MANAVNVSRDDEHQPSAETPVDPDVSRRRLRLLQRSGPIRALRPAAPGGHVEP